MSMRGGAIASQGQLVVAGCMFRGNIALGQGGSISHNGTTATIRHSPFEDSAAIVKQSLGTGEGGGIYIELHGDDIVLDGVVFTNCTAASDGGAVALGERPDPTSSDATITVSGCMFSACTAQQRGGGVALTFSYGSFSRPALAISGSTFTQCSAGGSSAGGGVFSVNSVIVTDSNFSGCTALSGGALAYDTATRNFGKDNPTDSFFGADNVRVIGCGFTNNTAFYLGGAVYASDLNPVSTSMHYDLVVRSSIFEGNVAAGGGGIAIATASINGTAFIAQS
ncbi:hypothetical protein JKP88DRAFT_245042 [Tribonema minus]|uniref:Right handed beta helix domain-containing protein n=1 Tax=Tribonema minus TaxID=303371 RepID=A0A835YZM1_9STRA|nr:hypothetical protein JKP88DRAFT_245042 [Tribonema minus]